MGVQCVTLTKGRFAEDKEETWTGMFEASDLCSPSPENKG